MSLPEKKRRVLLGNREELEHRMCGARPTALRNGRFAPLRELNLASSNFYVRRALFAGLAIDVDVCSGSHASSRSGAAACA
jgi:hypothetical protein